MPFSFADSIKILEIALILFASSFALLLPLYAYLKNFYFSLKICIPISISIEILTGYIFYTLGEIKIFPLTYFILILLLNLFFAFRLKLFEKIKKIRFKFNWKIIISALILIASILFLRFYDSVLNIAPGALDSAAHAQYVLDIDLYNRLSCTYYAPGFHILIYPLSKIMEMYDIYRFAGPVLGIIILLSIYLLFRDVFKNKFSKYFLLLAFGLPIFSILTLQTISFFPTVLTFVFIPMIVYALIKPKEMPNLNLVFFAITVIALALTVPYLLVQVVPAIVVLNIIALIAVRSLGKKYLIYITKTTAIIIFGFVLAFGHVYLQSAVSKKNNTRSFPQIMIVEGEGSDSGIVTNLEKTPLFLDKHSKLKKISDNSTVIKNYAIPMLMTGADVASIKNIRALNSIESLAAYLWIIISLFMIFFGARRQNLFLLTFGSMILVFGVATQTGILEMSTYRGRSGWYFLLFVLISLIYFLDKFIKKIPVSIIYILLAIMIIYSFFKPLEFYRPYFLEYFLKAKEISRQYPDQKILIITDKWRIVVTSKNFIYGLFKKESVDDVCNYDQCFIIFANKFFEVDPYRSQKLIVVEKDLPIFKADQAKIKQKEEEAVRAIKESKNFSRYQQYWENENISVYRFNK